ncbi:MAG: hypothetical protein H6836_03290 [Planctomycetes bacterium]|nr:hypothetical protein [Planctomycetota bacterium]
MRDPDDADEGEDDSPDNVLYAGFGPADYALPPGESAMQGAPPEYPLDVRSRVKVPRRAFLVLGAGVLASAASALWFGLRPSPTRDATTPRAENMPPDVVVLLAGCRALAHGPIDRLVHTHSTYIWTVRQHGGMNPELWAGMDRLVDYVLLDGSEFGATLARRLLPAYSGSRLPDSLARRRLDLEEFLRRRGRRAR